MLKLKNYILILISVILIFVLASCSNNTSTDTGSENTTNDTDTSTSLPDDGKLKISYELEKFDIYPSYKLGKYFGNGFKKEITCDLVGHAQYEIMQDYEETAESTTYGADIDEKLFETHYILALRFLYSPDNIGLIGINSFNKGEARIIANALYSANGNLDEEEYYYYYIAVPIKDLENWSDEGEMEIRKNSIDYIGTNTIVLDYTYEDANGYTQLLTKNQLENYIEENNIPIRIEAIGKTDNYIIHISKGRFDCKPSVMKPTYENGEIKLTVDYSISYHKAEKSYLSIIALNNNLIPKIDDVKNITVTLREIKSGILSIKDYKISDTENSYNIINLYPTFNGGVFYGTELLNMDKSAYTVIESISDLAEKAEFRISEDDLKDKIVIAMRLVGEKDNRIGFSGIEPTENGIKIISHISPYYEQIQNNSNDRYEIIYRDEDFETQENKVEYEYILASKELLNQIKKTGELTVVSNLTFNNYNIGTEVFEDSSYFHHVEYLNNKILNELDLKSGDTWRIKTNLQLIDFYEKYCLNLEHYDRLQKNKEYIVIYLDNYSDNDIFQWSVTESDNNLKLNYLVREIKEQTKDESLKGCFIFIEKSATENEITASIEYTEYEYSSCNVFPNDENTKAYDFYKMYLSDNKPDWKYKLISDFNTLSSTFYKYGTDEKKNGITAEDIFVSTVFEENYVLALYLTEGYSGAIKDTFYNARVSESNILYLYAFHSSNGGSEAIYEMLYFIIIPKPEIPNVIGDVEIQSTNEIVYNGPFEAVSIIGPSKDNVKIDITHLIINNQAELEKFFLDYNNYESTQDSLEIIQNIDFKNNFVLIYNRKYYKYYQGDFVNFKTTLNGIASITFMIDPRYDIIIDDWDEYYFDIVIIPKHYLKYQIDYFYVRFARQEREEAKDLIENQ